MTQPATKTTPLWATHFHNAAQTLERVALYLIHEGETEAASEVASAIKDVESALAGIREVLR